MSSWLDKYDCNKKLREENLSMIVRQEKHYNELHNQIDEETSKAIKRIPEEGIEDLVDVGEFGPGALLYSRKDYSYRCYLSELGLKLLKEGRGSEFLKFCEGVERAINEGKFEFEQEGFDHHGQSMGTHMVTIYNKESVAHTRKLIEDEYSKEFGRLRGISESAN
jgi:hypothetical protein